MCTMIVQASITMSHDVCMPVYNYTIADSITILLLCNNMYT